MGTLDLCAVCVAAVWPSREQEAREPSYGGLYVSTLRPGKSSRPGWPTFEDLEDGCQVDIPGGITLPMRAVTTVAGTRACTWHAGEVLEIISKRPQVTGYIR